jgi:dethiobiotin synthetase
MPFELFITGTDTGVGKTLVSTLLLRSLRAQGLTVRGLKPIASGATRTSDGLRNEDALALQSASFPPVDYATVNPHCFEPAVAPHLAAARAQTPIAFDRLVGWYRRAARGIDAVVTEGAGGWRVPLHPAGYLSDLPEALGLDVVLVVGLRLGCLNHARLTFEAIARGGRCRFAGWIGNGIDPDFAEREANLVALAEQLDGPALAIVPWLPSGTSARTGIEFDGAELLRRLRTS